MPPPPLTTTRRIKRIAPLQLGKLAGCLHGAMGLLFVPVVLLMPNFSAGAGTGSSGAGWLALCLPFGYAALGWVIGVIGAALYNFLAKWIGGIEVEVE